jgi:protein O-mannosyl-transferase
LYIARMNNESDRTVEPQTVTQGAGRTNAIKRFYPQLLILSAGVLVYLNSFNGQLLYDDRVLINASDMQPLWPLSKILFSPDAISRPLVALSLAMNYAISGEGVWSYHVVNLAIHLLAALVLFGVIRRALTGDRLSERFGMASTPLALTVALIWTVHPLQTESVTYIYQRAESMMGLFYLILLYCVIRGAQSARPLRWYAAAIAAGFLGMGCKQVIATAPAVVLLYDYVFLSESFKQIFKRRWILYAGLIATWSTLLLTVSRNLAVDSVAGFSLAIVTPAEYILSQFRVITHYLRLSMWPDPLVLDYYWPVARSFWSIAPFALFIGGLVIASIWALVRRWPSGFVGACFFIILIPTSSIMPIADLAVEHRLYLSLAAVIVFLVIGGYDLGSRWLTVYSARSRQQAMRAGVALVAIILTWFGSLTVRRNADYHSDLLMWADVVQKRPNNPRGHTNLGLCLAERGLYDEALAQCYEAIRINPAFVEAHLNAGMILANQGRGDEALPQFYETLRLRPKARRAHFNVGQVLASQGHWDDAIDQYRQEIEVDPQFRGAHMQMAMALEIQNRHPEALQQYREILSLWPGWSDPLLRLAALLISDKAPAIRNPHEAVLAAEQAAWITARQPVALDVLAAAYAADGRLGDAVVTAKEALVRATELKQDALRSQILSRLQKYEQGRAQN